MDHLYNPHTLEEALSILNETQGEVIAGGTDMIPQTRNGRSLPRELVNLMKVKELQFIRENESQIDIGACTTLAGIIHSPLLQEEAPSLVQACSLIGSVQTRNRATIGGNAANASPAGDTLPPLLIHNAQVALISAAEGERLIHLADYLHGPGRTSQHAGEIVQFLRLQKLPHGMQSAFQRVGNRSGMAVSVASTAVGLLLGGESRDEIQDLRIALGAVAPTAMRALDAERELLGRELTWENLEKIGALTEQHCTPIDDVRASKEYRQHITKKLVVRTLQQFILDSDQEKE